MAGPGIPRARVPRRCVYGEREVSTARRTAQPPARAHAWRGVAPRHRHAHRPACTARAPRGRAWMCAQLSRRRAKKSSNTKEKSNESRMQLKKRARRRRDRARPRERSSAEPRRPQRASPDFVRHIAHALPAHHTHTRYIDRRHIKEITRRSKKLFEKLSTREARRAPACPRCQLSRSITTPDQLTG